MLLLLIVVRLAHGQATQPAERVRVAIDTAVDWASLAESVLERAVIDGEIPGPTVVIANRNETIFTSGFGVSSLDTQAAVTDVTLFEVGSVGKVLTAIAVLQQVERGRLDLSADVNSYLEDWQVDPPGPTPLTLHHLLTHSAGLNDRAVGYAAREARDVQPLGVHLAEQFPTSFAPPGRDISYSNYGFGLAGYVVESVTRTPFTDYVASQVLEPLGIVQSEYRPSPDARVATGYVRQDKGFGAAPRVHRPVTPAGGLVASARDMGRLLHALLNDGSPILSSESVAMMTEVRQSQHPDLLGNSYGLEESRWGNLGGFWKVEAYPTSRPTWQSSPSATPVSSWR